MLSDRGCDYFTTISEMKYETSANKVVKTYQKTILVKIRAHMRAHKT